MQTRTDLQSAYRITEQYLIPVTGLFPLFPVYERPLCRCSHDIASRRRIERAMPDTDNENCPLLTPAMWVRFPGCGGRPVDLRIGGGIGVPGVGRITSP
jgi:hypothetical protein